MSDYLQKHFEDQATRQSHLKRLVSQWNFDQELIPKALQQVGQLFPHYSRHDQSHSEQILINIERLLGEHRIRLLSATDTWLLLEAAYWHDIGMVVPYQALKDALENPEFQIYRLQISADSSHELHDFALHFDGTDLTKAFTGAKNPLDAVNKFRILMAEWFRRDHHNRSDKSVNDPWRELAISSPRTELIPKRLFRLLGQICSLHGASFTDVLNQLPHTEVGISNDDCHPRFVACLLRLGDLLDMDDNRFCPVMQRIAGDDRPVLSKAHEEKHNSIRHFQLNSNRIEISAICESIDGYIEQWRWLDYLRSEIESQMARWQDIAPSPELGLLPTLGEVKVDIAGKQLITKPGVRPEFSLNSARVMKLLRGENLYQREDAIRELLQNAVDATLIRIWLDNKDDEKIIGDKPNSVFNEYCHKQKMNVRLERIEKPEPPINEEQIMWRFTVVDQGIGISQEDLPHLMNIASSSVNTKRQLLINEMPDWMRPSGTFGIGLQSVFMWADVVYIKTKSIYTNESLDIILHSPTGPQHGLVTIERAENGYLRPIGTEITFYLITERRSSQFSISHNQLVTSKAYYNHDSLLDKELPITAFQIGDAVLNFSKRSPIQVEWLFRNLDEELLLLDKARDYNESAENNDFFSETNSNFTINLDNTHNTEIFYRGQAVKDAKSPGYDYFGYTLDIYSGKAEYWLTFNRNSLTSEGQKNIRTMIAHNLMLWIKRNEQHLTHDHKTIISILAKIWVNMHDAKNDQAYWQNLAEKMPNEWKNLICSVITEDRKTNKTYREILKLDLIIIWRIAAQNIITCEPPIGSLVLACIDNELLAGTCVKDWCSDFSHGIIYKSINITSNNFGITQHQKTLMVQLVTEVKKDERLQISTNVLAFAIEKAVEHSGTGNRLLIPLILFPKDLHMERLSLNDNVRSYGFKYVLPYLPEIPMPHVCLPYAIYLRHGRSVSIDLSRLDEFVEWVNKNLQNKLSLHETKKAINDLIAHVDNVIMQNSTFWASLRTSGTSGNNST